MATLSDQEVKKLADALSKAMGGNTARKSSYSDKFDASQLEAYLKNNGNVTTQMLESMKKLTMSFKSGYDIYNKLEKATRDQADYVRKMNQSLSELIGNSKNAAKELGALYDAALGTAEGLKKYKDQLKEYNNSLKQIDELNTKRKDALKVLLDAEYALSQARKNKKNTTEAKEEIKKATEQVKLFTEALSSSKKNNKEITNEMDKFIEVVRAQNEITHALSEEELKLLANYKNLNTNSKEYVEVLGMVEASTKALGKNVTVVSDSLKENADKVSKSFDSFRASIGKAALQLLTKGPAVAFQDFLSQLRYNVNQSDYIHDIGLGMSEAERDRVIGENRTGLRVLGAGNEQAALATGGGREIQRAGWQYGVQGAQAIQLALNYQNSLMNMGYAGNNSKTIADQLTVMKNMTAQLGVTDEQLKSFYDDLVDIGTVARLNIKNENLSADEQRKSLNQEIDARIKLTKELGISLDRQKQLNQEAINKQYGDIASIVKETVGRQMQVSQYNAQNPNAQLSKEEMAAIQNAPSVGGPGGLSAEQQKAYYSGMQKIAKGNEERNQEAIKKGTLGSRIGFIANNVLPYQSLGINVGAETTEYLNTAARQAGQAGQSVVANTPYSELQKNIIDTTNNAFIPFNQAVLDATQRVQGFLKNPAGAAGKTAAEGVGSFAGSLLGSYLGNGGAFRGAGALGRGIGTLGRGAAGALDSVAATGSVGVGELATAGMAGIVPIVVGVLGAAAVGIAIGTLINHFIEGTKLGDAIGSGSAHVMAALGSQSAQDAIASNAAADKANSASDARMSAINAVTKAEHAAVAARGSKDESSLRQQAEALRNDYRQKYGVDLTGAGFGYDTSKNAPLSNATKFDENIANQTNLGTDAASRAQIIQLEKMVKLLQDQLDLAKKADQKADQDDQKEQGSTWKMYKEHIDQVRQGLS